MAGPLVPHGLAGDRQCVFLSGACRSIRETWRRFDIGSLGTALGLGKDKGVEIFQKNGDAFALHRLPGSYGCLVFNRLYPLDTEASLPTCAEIERIIEKMRICAGNAHIGGSDNARLNKMILWYSRRIIIMRTTDYAEQASENRVALSSPIIRAYTSLCWNCQNCIYDCRGVSSRLRRIDANHIRGPCAYADFSCTHETGKENQHEQNRKQCRKGAL